MDIQKEREAFEEYIISKHKNRSPLILTQRIQHGFSENYIVQGVQDCWETWQAVKAQAVPEGFVLIKKVHPDAIVHNQGLGLFKECQIIYGWDGKSKDFKDALNKGFYHGVKLGAKAVLETAMIEAQEQK